MKDKERKLVQANLILAISIVVLLIFFNFAGILKDVSLNGITGLAVSDGTNMPKQDLIYGSGISADSLGNFEVTDRNISYRFKAEHTGEVDKIAFVLMFEPRERSTYVGGNGGKLLVQLQTDNAETHFPSGNVLGSYYIDKPREKNNYPGTFVGCSDFICNASYPLLPLTPTPPNNKITLTQGEIYHIVFSNPDSEPAINWVSVNNIHIHCEPYGKPPYSQPRFSEEELDFLWREADEQWTRGCLGDETNPNIYTPTYSINFKEGYSQGQSYREVWINYAPYSPVNIAGDDMVREIIKVSESNRKVTAVSVRLAKKSGTSPKDLNFKLEGPDETIEEGIISAENIPYGIEQETTNLLTPNWVTYNFRSAHLLESGKTYNFTLSAPEGDPYIIYPIKDGYDLGLTGGVFRDGWALYSDDGGVKWYGFKDWGANNPENPLDFQFYFSLQVCGDGNCNGDENCSTCIEDCKACPVEQTCSQVGFTCRASCFTNETQASYNCTSGVCCKPETIEQTCQQRGYFCLPSINCSSADRLNYTCSSGVCCSKLPPNINITIDKTCAEAQGKICRENEYCDGTISWAKDTQECCSGNCAEEIINITEINKSEFKISEFLKSYAKDYGFYGIIGILIVLISGVSVVTVSKIKKEKELMSLARGKYSEEKIKEAGKLVSALRSTKHDNDFIKNLFLEKGWPEDIVNKLIED